MFLPRSLVLDDNLSLGNHRSRRISDKTANRADVRLSHYDGGKKRAYKARKHYANLGHLILPF